MESITRKPSTTPTAQTTAKPIPAGYEELVEGHGRALYRKGEVFYNNAQVVNRDLSVLLLRYFVQQRRKELQRKKPSKHSAKRWRTSTPTFTVLEALSATGLRAVRYWKEVEGLESVVANDLDPEAVDTIRMNVLHNGLDPKKEVIPNQDDAVSVMIAHRAPEKQFDIVDLDPYGSAAPLLDSAVQAVADDGMLCVTCTDLAVLCGNSPEICFGRYGSTPLKSSFVHEMAIRMVLSAIQAAANRHGRAVEPIVCAKIDFYVRLFVRVRASKALAQKSASFSALIYHCNGCGTFVKQLLGRVKEKPNLKFQPAYGPPIGSSCTECGSTLSLGGPIWAKGLSNSEACAFCLDQVRQKEGNEQLKAKDRIDALITVLNEEIDDCPLFMHLADMCKVLKISSPSMASMRNAVTKKGYLVSQSHTDPQAIKTNAPFTLLWDILRVWIEKNGRGGKGQKQKQKLKANENGDVDMGKPSVADRIVEKGTSLITSSEVDFAVKRDRFSRRGPNNDCPRFLPNPEPNWGPKSRAGKKRIAQRNENGEANYVASAKAQQKISKDENTDKPNDVPLRTPNTCDSNASIGIKVDENNMEMEKETGSPPRKAPRVAEHT